MWKMSRCKIISRNYIMFENFSKFFAVKKNIYIFIAALVILTGIFLLNRAGLYEGMDSGSADTVSVSEINKTPGTVKRQ
jgi:hypothetical protein